MKFFIVNRFGIYLTQAGLFARTYDSTGRAAAKRSFRTRQAAQAWITRQMSHTRQRTQEPKIVDEKGASA